MNQKNTKHFTAVTLIALLPLLFAAFCSGYKAEKPSVSLTVNNNNNNNTVRINSVVTFAISGDAEFMTIWTGDKKHNYDEYISETTKCDTVQGTIIKPVNSGEVIERNSYTYQYKTAGTYKVVVLAGNTGDFGETIEVQKIEYQIIVQ